MLFMVAPRSGPDRDELFKVPNDRDATRPRGETVLRVAARHRQRRNPLELSRSYLVKGGRVKNPLFVNYTLSSVFLLTLFII